MPLYGQLSEVFGRRWPAIFAVALFTAGSGIAGAANDSTTMIAGRAVQGIGGGGISLMTQLIISDLVSVRERGPYIGIVFAVFGLGTLVGPVLGGIIAEANWRWVFWLNLPIGGLTLILQLIFLQVEFKRTMSLEEKLRRIDWIGNALLITALISIMIALSWADTRYPWSDWHILVPLLVGFAGMIIFHVWESTEYVVQPTMSSHVFTNMTCAICLILTFMSSIILYWVMLFLPIYFQGVLLVSPRRSGVLLLPSVAFAVPAAIVSGILLTKFGRYKPLHLFSFAIMTLTQGLFTLLNRDSSLGEIIGFQVLGAIGAGFCLTTILPAAQANMPQSDSGVVTSTVSTRVPYTV
jgi:MFS family permease